MHNTKLLSLLKVNGLGEMPNQMTNFVNWAQLRTYLLSKEQVKEQFGVGVQQSKVEDFMRMVGLHLNSVMIPRIFPAPRGLVDYLCKQTDKYDRANPGVCKDAPRLFEAASKRSDCSAEARWTTKISDNFLTPVPQGLSRWRSSG